MYANFEKGVATTQLVTKHLSHEDLMYNFAVNLTKTNIFKYVCPTSL